MNNLWSQKITNIASFYEGLIDEHGYHPRACDYGRSQSQKIKFKVLAQVMPLTGKRVLDVGCGFADFANYLKYLYKEVIYEGIDVTPRMIEEARRLHPNISLAVVDILTEDISKNHELVTANGIFYRLGEEAERYMQNLVKKMFHLSSSAVAFNSLSTWAPTKVPGEFYADPLRTVQFCRQLTPWVVLRHDYMPHDFTIYMYKKPYLK